MKHPTKKANEGVLTIYTTNQLNIFSINILRLNLNFWRRNLSLISLKLSVTELSVTERKSSIVEGGGGIPKESFD